MKTMIMAISMFSFILLGAVPSTSALNKKAKSLGALKIKWMNSKGVITKLNKKTLLYSRAGTAYYSTKYKGITYTQHVEIKYIKINNGKWMYQRVGVFGEPNFKGLKAPKSKDLIKLINANMSLFLPYSIEGKLKNLKTAKKSTWIWPKMNQLIVNFEVDYSRKINYTEIADIHAIITLRFYKGGGNGGNLLGIDKGPFVRFLRNKIKEKIIKKRKFTKKKSSNKTKVKMDKIENSPSFSTNDVVSFHDKYKKIKGYGIVREVKNNKYKVEFASTTEWFNSKLLKKEDNSKKPTFISFKKDDKVKVKVYGKLYEGKVLKIDEKYKKAYIFIQKRNDRTWFKYSDITKI